MTRLSILQMNTSSGFGGGEQVFLDLCRNLKSRGHRVGAIVRKNGALLNALRESDIEVAAAVGRGGFRILLAARLGRMIDSGAWQLINAHTPPDYMSAALAARFSSSRPKLVMTRHIMLPLGETLLHRWTFASIDAFIAVSHAVEETLINHPLIDAGKVRTIWNGIDTDRFAPDGTRSLRGLLGIAEGEHVVGILGEISPHKGQEVFLKAAMLLLQSGCKAKFIIAGPTRAKNKHHLTRLRSMVRDSRWSSEIRFLDRVSDMPDAMRSIDVMVLASEAEPFGLVTVEGMACGRPVVAARTGASGEIITDRCDGLLVDPGSHEAIASAIAGLLSDEKARETLGAKARQTAVQKFSLNRNIDAVESLYFGLCD